MAIHNSNDVGEALKNRLDALLAVQQYEREIVTYLLREGRMDLFNVNWRKIDKEFWPSDISRTFTPE